MWSSRRGRAGLALLLVGSVVAATLPALPPWFSLTERESILQLSPLPPPPEDDSNAYAQVAAAAALGRAIFFNPRFSRNGTIACVSCHDPHAGWSNGQRFGKGLATSRRNVPTLWDTAYNRWLFFDGRENTAWGQALRPLEDSTEQGGRRVDLIRTVVADPGLRVEYAAAFGRIPHLGDRERYGDGRPLDDPRVRPAERDSVNRMFVNLGKALAAFERTLVAPRTRFDRFAEGIRDGDRRKRAALSWAEQRGLRTFIGRGQCTLCHSGPNFSDGEFHNLGLPEDLTLEPDPGRYAGIPRLLASPFTRDGPFSDRHPDSLDRLAVAPTPETFAQFKTPGLRNVALTAPYMHDGQFATLDQVLDFYSTRRNATPLGHHEEGILRPLHLRRSEIRDLIAFLNALTDTSALAGVIPPPVVSRSNGPGSTGVSTKD